MVAVVEHAGLYEWALGPAKGPLGITLEAMRARLRNATCPDRGAVPLRRENVISEAALWATVEYATVEQGPITGRAQMRVERAGTGHGLALWFDAVLAEGQGFSTGPGHELCYGRLFLPWARPVPLNLGDRVSVDLWAQSSGEPWGWNSVVTAADGSREEFKQSSFLGGAGRLTPRGAGERGYALSQRAQS
jgi:hypothetical protein